MIVQGHPRSVTNFGSNRKRKFLLLNNSKVFLIQHSA